MEKLKPTRAQYKVAREIVRWYLKTYHRTDHDIGLPPMFCDPSMIGHFAISKEAFEAGDGEALFKMLVGITMYQRRQDAQIMRVQRSMTSQQVEELTDFNKILIRTDLSPCEHIKTVSSLKSFCDLGKDPETKKGVCKQNPKTRCHLKTHTVLMKRYGHFGKVPTSAALTILETGAKDLSDLKDVLFLKNQSRKKRALALESALCSAWRINDKIAALFLSALTNPDLSEMTAPWSEGIDWTYFVVVDSNVDLFLKAIEYPGPWTYSARRGFLRELSKRIALNDIVSGYNRYNPRIVQQALYLFMSETNRRNTPTDCSHDGHENCPICPNVLKKICSLKKAN